MDPLEQLPATLNRRSWLILLVMLLVSLLLGDPKLTIGILCGGLISTGAFLWLRRSLNRLLAEPDSGAKARYQFGYVVRLIALAAVLVILIAIVKIDTVGLLIGLSVVVINLFWTTIQQALKH